MLRHDYILQSPRIGSLVISHRTVTGGHRVMSKTIQRQSFFDSNQSFNQDQVNPFRPDFKLEHPLIMGNHSSIAVVRYYNIPVLWCRLI